MRAELDLDKLRRLTPRTVTVLGRGDGVRVVLVPAGDWPAILGTLELNGRLLEAVHHLRLELQDAEISGGEILPAERTLLHLAGAGEEVRHG